MMKKRIAMLLAAALLVVIVGCGKNAAEPGAASKDSGGNTAATTGSSTTGTTTGSGSTTTTNPATTPQKPTYTKVNLGPLKKGDTAKVGPLTVTVTDVAVTRKAAGLPPGYAYVSVMVTIVNEGDLYTINTTDHFRTETPQARVSKVNVQAMALREPRLQGSIDKGATASGWLGFLLKVMDGTYKFGFSHPDFGDAVWEFTL